VVQFDSVETTTPGDGSYIYRLSTMSAIFRFTVAARCSSERDIKRTGKYTDARVESILNLLKKGVTAKGAATASGISEKTFYLWKRDQPTFAAAVEQTIGESEANLVQIALEGTRRNPQLAIRLLERRFRKWARHSSQEAKVTGEITTTVAPELVAALQSMPETVGRREVDLLVN